jgi:hypothetical protein
MEIVDDILGHPPDDPHVDAETWAAHPHRRPLRWQRERRAGSVPAPSAYCLSPVGPSRGVEEPRSANASNGHTVAS